MSSNGQIAAWTVVQFQSNGTKDWGFRIQVTPWYSAPVFESDFYWFRIEARDISYDPYANWIQIQRVYNPDYTLDYIRTGEQLAGLTFEFKAKHENMWGTYGAASASVSLRVGFSPIEVRGSKSADMWFGSVGKNDRIFGFGGNDILSGGFGNDSIDGGAGNDQLFGVMATTS